MIEIKLGDRYAKSVYGLAEEKGVLEEVRKDFKSIESICKSNPDFVAMLKSPLIHSDKKEKVLDAIFGKSFNAMTKTFLEIIVRKKREPYLVDIAMRFGALYDRQNNIMRGVLSSAVPLSPDLQKRIKDIVEKDLKTSFVMEEKIDPELIGGFSLKVGDHLFDATIAESVRKLKKEFDKNPYIKLT